MDEFVVWLRAQLDEDERIARAAGGLNWSRSEHPWDTAVAIRDSKGERVVCDEGWPSEGQEVHIAEWDPARVLRETAAKRAIIEHVAYELEDRGGGSPWWYADKLLPILKQLGTSYADRPGYRDDWRP